jgi:adenine-specific DNA-methyltransferase
MQEIDSLHRLKGLLRELFQLDVADLDFGLYRLFHLKRTEIEIFLDKHLPAEVDRVFEIVAGAEREALQKRMDELAIRARASVADDAIFPNGEPNPTHAETKAVKEYLEARRRFQGFEASEAQRAEVFNLLYAFFSRYYDNGDFIPRRFYGARAAYAVANNGEEVLFHWANKDQYYVKSSETFRDYAFLVPTVSGEYRVRFKLTAATAPKDNTKGDTRFLFPLPKESAFDKVSRTFTVLFHYRLPTSADVAKYGKNAKGQEAILDEAAPKILAAVPDEFLRAALAAAQSPTGREAEEEQPPLLLRRRLTHFTKKHNTDYFVHKNLGAFLRQELEFFVRDQVVHEADLEGDFEAKRRTFRVFRKLADTIITFLAQIEDAQKRLFEKKKFVLRTDYLVPIQHVPRDLWSEVFANKAQLAEWKALHAVEPKLDLVSIKSETNKHAHEQYSTLAVDTRHFSPEFTSRLLPTIGDLDEQTNGVLIYGENFQALTLVRARFREQVKCIYIDPPYNTGSDEFIYKDRYRHSSWLAMMENRLQIARDCMTDEGALFSSIDANEVDRLKNLLDSIFGEDGHLNTFVWINNLKGRQISGRGAAGTHEYVLAYGNANVSSFTISVTRGKSIMPNVYKGFDYEPQHDRVGTYVLKNELFNTNSKFNEETRSNLVFNIHWNPHTGEIRFSDVDESVEFKGFLKIPPKENNDGVHRFHAWRWDKEKIIADRADLEFVTSGDRVRIFTKVRAFQSTALKDIITDISTTVGSEDLVKVLPRASFLSHPKPVKLIEIFAGLADDNELTLDFFAGSGTTGHAIINLNREDGKRRKFILVEVADYFDSVLVPRIKKVMFTPEWKDGKSVRPPTNEEAARTPRLLKVLRLESYEDALHNTFSNEAIERLAEREKAYRDVVTDEEYRIQYLVKLPLEASDSMLNLGRLEHPFNYTLEVLTDHGPKIETVDLIETFNWLYGLRVHSLLTWVNQKEKGGKEKDGRTYRVVVASERDGKKRVLVVWRDMTGLDPAVERPFLETKAKELGSFEEQWINGDSTAKGFASLDGLFKRLMSEGD